MSGELWLGSFQIGKEVTPGTAVPATRKMYFRPDSTLTYERESRPHRFQTGRRDNIVKRTLGPRIAGGSVSQAMSASEIVELLLMTIQGAVTPTTPGGATTTRLWTFKPASTLDSVTVEWHDGARPWRETGAQGGSIGIAGNVKEENVVTVELFGRGYSQQALTPALTDRTPGFYEGWATKLYVDALGATPGTTPIAGTMISWDVTINNNMARKYFADNTLDAGGTAMGELEIEATLVFEASPAAALTEFNNWENGVDRLVRLEFGNNLTLEAALKEFVTVDLPGAWTGVDLGGDDEGTRTYELSYGFIYDPVLAAGVQVRAQNNRATAY